jgi:hypothetical protein
MQAIAELEGLVCCARHNGDLGQLAYDGGASEDSLSGAGADSKVLRKALDTTMFQHIEISR